MKLKLNFASLTRSMAVVAMVMSVGSALGATWDLYADCVSGASSTTGFIGSTKTCSDVTPTAAWPTGVSLSAFSTYSTAAGNFVAADIYTYGGAGLGIVAISAGTPPGSEGTGEGPHAMDSVGTIDGMLLTFGSKVRLSELKIGWNGSDANNAATAYDDSDLAVYAWTGTGAPPVTGGGTSQLTAVNSGWTLIGNYADVGASNGTNTFGGTANLNSGGLGGGSGSVGVNSSYWLVTAAFNNGVGTTTYTGGNDSFKLLSVTGITAGVSEPGSLALFGLGLLGFMATRRRRTAAI